MAFSLANHHYEQNSSVEEIELFENLFVDLEWGKNFAGKQHSKCIEQCLKFLREGGYFSNPKYNLSIDCPRFFLKVLEELRVMHLEVLCCEEKYRWETYALIIDHVYELLKVGINKERFLADILFPLSEEFESHHCWNVKIAFIRSLRGIIYKVFEMNHIYWACCESQLKHCYTAATCFRKGCVPENIKKASCEIVDLWREIPLSATQRITELKTKRSEEKISTSQIKDIDDEIKRIRVITEEKIVSSSIVLLRLIDICQLSLNLGIDRYTEMLRSLELDTVTSEERLMLKEPQRNKNTEDTLLKLYQYVFKMRNDTNNENYQNKVITDSLFPYLLGQKEKPDRRHVEHVELSKAELCVSTAQKPFTVEIADICAATHRVFRIGTDKLTVKKTSKIRYPIKRDELDDVQLFYNKEQIEHKFPILSIPYITSKGRKMKYSSPCELLSIVREHGSQFFVLSCTKKKKHREWEQYVDRLPKAEVYQEKL
jgi:hypothetical protein